MYIITWSKKICSPIHDHSSNGCMLKVLKGTLIENIYDKDLKMKYKNIIQQNNCGCIHNDIGYHSIDNIFNNICISLHIYSPPNYETNYYD